MMISDNMCAQLNRQVINELYASHLYLAVACTFNKQGLKVFARRFMIQAEEEREHALKLVKYVLDVGGEVVLGGIAKPTGDFSSARSMVKTALDHELLVTRQFNELVALAQEESDHATGSFLQWYVDEQVEEVSSMTDLLQLIEMAGDQNLILVEARLEHDMPSASE